MIRRAGEDQLADVGIDCRLAQNGDVDPMSGEPGGNVSAGLGAVSRPKPLCIHDQDDDLFRRHQEGKCLSRCARAFTAGVPAQRDRIAGLGANTDMRHDQSCATGRNRHRLREIARCQRFTVRLGLAKNEQVCIASLNDQLLFVVTLGEAPFTRQVTALDGLVESGGGGIVFGLRRTFVRLEKSNVGTTPPEKAGMWIGTCTWTPTR